MSTMMAGDKKRGVEGRRLVGLIAPQWKWEFPRMYPAVHARILSRLQV